ncbi:MAG: FAD-dependent oxidoreductase [Lentisphaeria bacterium]|nr:FAD-dependent oxidoreductase [Lentisphaeria bacterium]
MDIVIAGGGVAAFEAALAARKYSPDCRIVIHSAENVLPYRRPALPGLISSDEAAFTKMFIRQESFYQENRLEVRLNSRLTAVDAASKKALFNGSERVSYDALVLATGGKAFVPDLPGAAGENVLTLRSFEDLLKLRKSLASGAGKITVIGGGILGLELVDALLQSGVRVTLLEQSERLLSRNISPEDSRLMMQELAGLDGLEVIYNARTTAITPQGAVLSTGETVASDLVIFSTGSRPELAGLPPELHVDKAIVVDEYMRTNLPGIYACGDNSQFAGNVCGLYATSRAMASVAGANAAGAKNVYVPKAQNILLNTLGFKMSPDGHVIPTGTKH